MVCCTSKTTMQPFSGLPCQYNNGIAFHWFGVPVHHRRSFSLVSRASTLSAQLLKWATEPVRHRRSFSLVCRSSTTMSVLRIVVCRASSTTPQSSAQHRITFKRRSLGFFEVVLSQKKTRALIRVFCDQKLFCHLISPESSKGRSPF